MLVDGYLYKIFYEIFAKLHRKWPQLSDFRIQRGLFYTKNKSHGDFRQV